MERKEECHEIIYFRLSASIFRRIDRGKTFLKLNKIQTKQFLKEQLFPLTTFVSTTERIAVWLIVSRHRIENDPLNSRPGIQRAVKLIGNAFADITRRRYRNRFRPPLELFYRSAGTSIEPYSRWILGWETMKHAQMNLSFSARMEFDSRINWKLIESYRSICSYRCY